MSNLIPVEIIESKIYLIRNQKVMLDKDLANLYGVATKKLNQAVKRNMKRFPQDFMFQLTWDEIERLRSQFVTLKISNKSKRGKHIKYLPFAFTEQGVAMLSSILNSDRAIEVNIQIMRVFIRLKQFIHAHKELEGKFDLLEKKVGEHLNKHDEEITAIFSLIKKMLIVEAKPKRRIGFIT